MVGTTRKRAPSTSDLMKLLNWSCSDVGRKRDHNEDSFLIDEALSLYAVADGMGGHQGGDHASRMAVNVLHDEVLGAKNFDEAAQKLVDGDPTLLTPAMDPIASAAAAAQMSHEPGAPSLPHEDVPTNPALLIAPPSAATVLRSAARTAGR